jgi:hypothetical protein
VLCIQSLMLAAGCTSKQPPNKMLEVPNTAAIQCMLQAYQLAPPDHQHHLFHPALATPVGLHSKQQQSQGI